MATEEEIEESWQSSSLQTLSDFLIEQTSILCDGSLEHSMSFQREVLFQRMVLSQEYKSSTKTLISSKLASKYISITSSNKNNNNNSNKKNTNNNNNDNNKSLSKTSKIDTIDEKISNSKLPFEAKIGIKLLLSTLNSMDPNDALCFDMIVSMLPHLKEFTKLKPTWPALATAQTNKDLGLITRICDFLIRVLLSNNEKLNENSEVLSQIVSIILALSIAAQNLSKIIDALHRILTNTNFKEVKLPASQALELITNIESKKVAQTKLSSLCFFFLFLFCFVCCVICCLHLFLAREL